MKRKTRHLRIAVLIGLLVVATLPLYPATSQVFGQEKASYVQDHCHEVVSFVAVPEADVRPHIPNKFKLLTDNITREVNLILRTAICDRLAVAGGEAQPTMDVKFGVEIEQPDHGRPERCCNFYVFFLASNNKELVSWQRQETGLGSKAVYVEDLSLNYDRDYGGLYAFDAPAPTPSPFALKASAPKPPDLSIRLEVAWWVEKDGGAIAFRSLEHDFRLAPATARIMPHQGTMMAKLLGGERDADVALSNEIPEATTVKEFVDCGEACGPPGDLLTIG